MKAHRAAHSIATLCQVLEVSPSGYYAWHRRTPSPRGQEDASLTAEIEAIHTHSRGTYGVPRIHAELVARGRRVGRKRVTRLMRAARLRGVSRRKFVVTTTRAAEARPAPDLVRRAFTATGPRSALGRRPHLHPHGARLSLLGGGARRLESSHRRLGDGDASAHDPRPGRAGHGRRAAATPGGHSSFRIRAARPDSSGRRNTSSLV